jgi:hypothetical protein
MLPLAQPPFSSTNSPNHVRPGPLTSQSPTYKVAELRDVLRSASWKCLT